MHRSKRARFGAVLVSFMALGAASVSGPSAVAAQATSSNVKVSCNANYVCGWSGTGFTGLGTSHFWVESGHCAQLPIGVRSVINYAFVSQRLWTGVNCTGSSVVVGPGESRTDLGSSRRGLGGL